MAIAALDSGRRDLAMKADPDDTRSRNVMENGRISPADSIDIAASETGRDSSL